MPSLPGRVRLAPAEPADPFPGRPR